MHTREVIGGYSLLYTWPGSDTTQRPMLLMGHMDVVPVETGTESRWTHPPFSGDLADGFVWGRGALDDKGTVIAVLEAAEMLLEQGFQPRRTIFLAFGHDEETGRGRGAGSIARVLQERVGSVAFIVDEGGIVGQGLMPGLSRTTALIGITEKGWLNLELTAASAGGHSSAPPPHSAVGVLSRAITRLEENQMPARITPVMRRMLEVMAPELPFGARLALANLWLTRPVVVSQFLTDAKSAAMLRTTTAATMITGSPKSNVLPSQARAVVNFRLLPGDSPEDVEAHARRVIADTAVKITRLGEGRAASPVSDDWSAEYKTLEKSVAQLFPGAVPVPFLLIGGTDTRQYEALSPNVFRFMPFTADATLFGTVHGTSERMRADDFARGVRFYAQLIRNSQ
jgi:carboxypeptidase PM20D1